MKIADWKGYEIHLPTSGGKAGTGHNVTSGLQIRAGSIIAKTIRFNVDKANEPAAVCAKAKAWIERNPIK